jgi:S-adenosyl-L-methionine hydrolase (adenosine-forming)
LSSPIITLTTDYGLGDYLVGTLKGVILKINPDATIVDITHSVTPYDVMDGALAIAAAYRYFPPKTIHVVIVDPGVGSERRPLLVSGENQFFVAPDNGVLSLIYENEAALTVRNITAEHYFIQPVSRTFHGRDVFAPVAAWLSKTWQMASFGEEIQDFRRFSLPKPKVADGQMNGLILRVDAFGNLMTNFTPADLPEITTKEGTLRIQVGEKEVNRLVGTFTEGKPGEPVAMIGSTGFIEIVINKGNASRTFGAGRGAAVVIPIPAL